MKIERLAKMPEKIPFSHDIDPEVRDLFDHLCDNLPGAKYQILEAMIRSFAALPRPVQVNIIGGEWAACAGKPFGLLAAERAVLNTDEEAIEYIKTALSQRTPDFYGKIRPVIDAFVLAQSGQDTAASDGRSTRKGKRKPQGGGVA